MSILRSSISLASRASRTGIPLLTRSVAVKNATTVSVSLARFYSSKPEDKKEEYKSILNDDLLAQTGIDVDSIKKEGSTSESESESSESEEKQQRYSKDPKRAKRQSSIDKKMEKRANMFYISVLALSIGGAAYLSRDWEESEESFYKPEENGYTPGLIWKRFSTRFSDLVGIFSEPAFNDLLPPPAAEEFRRPLTLVLTLDDLLIHSEWSPKNGWRTAKRPGLDYFLGYLSQYYEIVIFSSTSMAYSERTVAKLDPYHAFISHALFREACRYKDGKIIKDLSLMNRDLGKIVIIDVDSDAYSLQPENAIPVEKWDGQPDDKLVQMIPFLEYLATNPRLKDVRPILNSFPDKTQIPEEFIKREKILRQQFEAEQKAKGGNGFSLGLGIARPAAFPLDLIREHGQRNYLNMYNYLKEHGEELLRQEKEREKQIMAEQNMTLGKLLTEGVPNPEEVLKQQQELQQQQSK
ncbi:unnamed protein product [Kuraishia capsulata CBS 1993]|uniref:Mitochondrial import inner membrane translocase subunit TIM50 n=1 Tax=Kuraishia capsulata CBS 1993 TaxID=1382522 RepID=W6MX14_9ASCO|nr:uncharacterized protein KUCA_T00004081001 [Kuraishia capsulata CBS 1993]CDK28100.1 unnamed protein product [Kuraishia capsulata CBS 1993]